MFVNYAVYLLCYLVLSHPGSMCWDNDLAKSEALIDYALVCPSTALCTQDPAFSLNLSCCGSCSCNVSCMDADSCCPDGPQDFLTQEEIDELKRNDIYKCLKPRITNEAFTDKHPFYEMIGRCPFEHDNENVAEKCVTSYETFDLENGVYNIPVTSITSGLTYKNIYCAMCHGVVIEDVVYWTSLLTCIAPIDNPQLNVLSFINMTSIHDLNRVLIHLCDVLYETPLEEDTNITASDYKTCLGLIDRCNVTGTWVGSTPERDYQIETACLSYDSKYANYRNVHCYMCNGGDMASGVTCNIGSTTSYSVNFTLQFPNNAAMADPERDNQCTSSFVYDNYTMTCLSLHCPKGFSLTEEKCVPLLQPRYKSYLYHVYEVVLTFEPDSESLTRRVTTRAVTDLFSKVEDNIYLDLPKNKSADDISVCDRRAFIKFKQRPVDLVNTLQNERRKVLFYDVMYMAISFRMQIQGVDDIDAALDDVFKIYNASSVTLDKGVVDHVPRVIDENLINKVFKSNTGINKTDVDEEMVKGLDLNEKIRTALLNITTDESDGFAVAPLEHDLVIVGDGVNDPNRCLNIGRLEVNVSCPKIKFVKDEFTTDANQVYLKNLDMYVDVSEGQFGTGMDMFYICLETFRKIRREWGVHGNMTGIAVPLHSSWCLVLVGLTSALLVTIMK